MIRFLALIHLSMAVLSAAPDEGKPQTTANRPEKDLVTWADETRGKPFTVRFISSDENNITVEKTLASGRTTRTLPHSEIAALSFTFTPWETEIHTNPAPESVPELRALWQSRKATLQIPESSAAQTGLALARALRMSSDESALEEALGILTELRSHGALQNLQKPVAEEELNVRFLKAKLSQNTEEADRLAWAITENLNNPDGMLLATQFLGQRHFDQLKALEEEHPRWMDDDEIRPRRKRLYNLSLDFFTYPSLFHGTRKKEASSGLARVAAVHRFTGSNTQLKAALEDLAALYPESKAAAETAEELKQLRARKNSGNLAQKNAKEKSKQEEETAKADQETVPNAPPPPPKKYNLFTD